jgi:hypothetical protein
MKTLHLLLVKTMLSALLLMPASITFSQPTPDYTFQSPVLLSGTDRAVGAVYRFSNVKTGVDAIVTIVTAVNASVVTLDQTGQGWNAAFQPFVNVLSMTTGYIDFEIRFVTAGTMTLLPQSNVAITAMDVDGYNSSPNQRLYEFEQFDMGFDTYAEYESTGSDITISTIGTAFRGTNVAGVEYGSINTSPNVRFTVFRNNPTGTMYVRTGANNQDVFNNVSRQRSFYFARFTYPNSNIMVVLKNTDLKSFNAQALSSKSVKINWELATDHTIQKIVIERSGNGQDFEPINTIHNPSAGHTEVADYNASKGTYYYRIHLFDEDGKSFYSQIKKVSVVSTVKKGLEIFPTLCSNNATLSINAAAPAQAIIKLVNSNGQIILTRKVQAQSGRNEWPVDVTTIPAGSYFVMLELDNQIYSGMLIRQAK